jgi:hypothetical protein
MQQTLEAPTTNGKLREIKPIFAQLGSREYNPRQVERARWLIVGFRKRGKTHTLCSNPDAVVLDIEGGASAVVHPKAFVLHIQPTQEEMLAGKPKGFKSLDPWKRFLEAKAILLKDATSGSPNFLTVGIDSLDALFDLAMGDFCGGNNGLKKVVDNLGDYKDGTSGWYELRKPFMRHLQELDNAGYGLTAIVHKTETVIQGGPGGKTIISSKWATLPPTFRGQLLRMFDQICHVEWEAIADADQPAGNRKVRTHRALVMRTIDLPDDKETGARVAIPKLELPLGKAWDAIADAYNKEVTRVKSEEVSSEG